MTLALPRPVSRAAALALLGLVLLAFARLVVAPFTSSLAELRQQIETERRLLGRYEALSMAERQGKGAAPTAAPPPARALLAGESEAIQVASLQAMLGELAGAHGVEVRSARTLPARDSEGLRLLGVELRLAAGMAALQRLLHAIETGTPTLLLATLHVMPHPDPARGEPGDVLEARIEVLGAAARKRGAP
jgi:hypothetical protein